MEMTEYIKLKKPEKAIKAALLDWDKGFYGAAHIARYSGIPLNVLAYHIGDLRKINENENN